MVVDITNIWIIIPLIIWDAIWHAARKGQKIWFVALAVVNSIGILPIIYLVFFTDMFKKKKRKS